MISVATPHLAEDWWKIMGNNDLVAGRIFSKPVGLTSDEKSALEAETYVRSFLEQARKVAKVARQTHRWAARKCYNSHLRPWKRELAVAAINHVSSGGNVKSFAGILTELPFVNPENKGEIIGFWGKRMLPQIFKWSDEEKA